MPVIAIPWSLMFNGVFPLVALVVILAVLFVFMPLGRGAASIARRIRYRFFPPEKPDISEMRHDPEGLARRQDDHTRYLLYVWDRDARRRRREQRRAGR